MKARKGFTLVEILIVVVILGILAAIVIPQFSQASTDAKSNSLMSNLQSMRSQIELYKIQHNDAPPSLADFVAQMTGRTDVTGAVGTTFGPYLQRIPNNPFTNENDVAGNDAGDWVYNEGTGSIRAGLNGGADIQVNGISITNTNYY